MSSITLDLGSRPVSIPLVEKVLNFFRWLFRIKTETEDQVKTRELTDELRARGVPILDRGRVERHKERMLKHKTAGPEAAWRHSRITKEDVPRRLAARVGIAQELGAEVYEATFYRDPLIFAVRDGSDPVYIGAYETGVPEFDKA